MLRSKRKKVGSLFTKKLTHPSFPSPTFVQRYSSILGAPPRETCALSTEYVHKLFLAQVLNLLRGGANTQLTFPMKEERILLDDTNNIKPNLFHIFLVIAESEVDISIDSSKFDSSSIISSTYM